MADSAHNKICNYLKSLNFHFLNSWVQECVDYYHASNPSVSENDLKNEVRMQWLLLNLREMNVPALPADLKSKSKVILPAKYVVQVETMVDSGQSRYSQLQSLRNEISNENVRATSKVSEDLPSRRCLTMTITDGVQDLMAMEYEIIPALRLNDPELLPGFKMLISGPVTCRRGMIMLSPQNVTICGGEVDTLAETNNLERILMNSLGVDGPLTATNKNILQRDDAEPSSNNAIGFTDENDDFLLDFPMEVDNTAFNGRAENSLIGSKYIEPRVEPNVVSVAEFEDEDTMDDLILQCEKAESLTNQQPARDSTSLVDNETIYLLPTKLIASQPFVYLAQIIELQLSGDSIFKVKAVILTLKTKISVRGDAFTLQAKICDGSKSIDVYFASEVLEDMLGFSPSEMAHMVKAKSKNSAIGEKLKSAFSTTQKRLISLNCIFLIQFFANKSLPCVLSLDELSNVHLQQLQSRKV